jgi:large subunit ribosomal protein L19
MSLLQEVQSLAIKRQMPEIRPGNTVKIHQKIQEGGKTRIQIYQGIVIKINSGFGADKTITVRKVTDGIGVEKTFPLYSTNIEKITVVKIAKVRRAKLYYLRERFGKSARMKEELLGKDKEFSSREFEEEAVEMPVEENAELSVEEAQTEEAPKTEELETAQESAPTEEVSEPVSEEAPEEQAPTEEPTQTEAPAEEASAEEKKEE